MEVGLGGVRLFPNTEHAQRLFGRAKSGDTETEVPEVHVWTVRNGKIVDLEAIFDTATALRAWLGEP